MVEVKTFGTVVVTGAGGGLGAAVAERLAHRAEHVACVDLDGGAADATAARLRESGARAEGFEANVANPADVDRLRDNVNTAFGRVGTVINVAGIIDRRQMAELDMEAFSRVLSVNLTGLYGVTRAFAEDLRSCDAGRVVNVASNSGTIGYEFPAYATSKAAVIHLTKALLIDFWGSGVVVNAVSPGPMLTPMLNESATKSFINMTPTGRVSNPGEVAEVIEFLASPNQWLINGQNILLDGGATTAFRWQPPAINN